MLWSGLPALPVLSGHVLHEASDHFDRAPDFRCRVAGDREIVNLSGPQMQVARHARSP